MAFRSRTLNSVSPDAPVERESRTTEGMTDISRTLFLPLFFRAQETREGGIINDPEAVRIVDSLGYENRNFILDREMQLIMALRTEVLDGITARYIADCRRQGHQPVIVNLGAGLDTREQRFPEAQWYQVDLDAPMRLRSRYIKSSRATHITGSIFEEGWTRDIVHRDHALLIVEGVLMYFDTPTVRRFFDIVARDFHSPLVAFDALARRYSTLQTHQSVDVDRAPFRCGVSSSADVVHFGLGFAPVAEYGYYQAYLAHADELSQRYRVIRFDATHKVYLVKRLAGAVAPA